MPAQVSDRISLWLSNLPTISPLPQPRAVLPKSLKRQRSPLADISGNMDDRAVKARQEAIDAAEVEGLNAERLQRVEEEENDDATPVQKRLNTGSRRALAAQPLSPLAIRGRESGGTLPPPSLSCPSVSLTASSATGESRKRKRSPVKKMAGMRYIHFSVLSETIPDLISQLPPNCQVLCDAMRRYAKGHGIIPVADKESLGPLLDDPSEWHLLLSDDRLQHGSLPDHSLLVRIMDHARGNERLGRSEAAWNCNVHSQLLDHAWYCSKDRDRLECENITTASIEPASLMPAYATSESISSKKADFAIVLSLGFEREKAIAQADIFSLNQTEYEPVRYSPIALSIETKIPGEGWDDAQLQLSTWVLAQIAMLKELCLKAGNTSVTVPPLPVLVILGHDWIFMLLEDCGTSAKLWKKITIGSTETIRGIYQILAALQYLMSWATDVYKPWLEQNIFEALGL